MKKKLLLQQQHDMYVMLGMIFILTISGITFYIVFYKRKEFVGLVQDIWESILFGSSLTFTAIFDKMFSHKHYYERRNRATIVKSSIVDTGLIHKRPISKNKRTSGRK